MAAFGTFVRKAFETKLNFSILCSKCQTDSGDFVNFCGLLENTNFIHMELLIFCVGYAQPIQGGAVAVLGLYHLNQLSLLQ